MTDVSVVIVTWNAAAFIEGCLDAIPSDLEIVVVDNASSDATVEVVGTRPAVTTIANTENRGFAAAANQGVAATSSERVLLLNPDAQLGPGTLRQLVDVLDRDPTVAVVSALVVDPSGRPERQASGREPTPLAVATHELGLGRWLAGASMYGTSGEGDVIDVDWAAGTCLLLRRQPFESVGGFDEDYFLYCEDMDLCRRLRDRGHRVVVHTSAAVVHRRSTSVNQAGPWIDRHRIGSLDRYISRHHRRTSVLAIRLARLAGAAARAAAFTALALMRRRPDLASRARQRRRDTALLARALLGRAPRP